MFHATTILSVRTKDQVALIGDGQVTMGSVVAKGTAQKIRRLHGNILAGYAGGVADALILIEQLEKSLDKHSGQLQRACIELVKGWRSSIQYAKLEASVLVSDLNNTYTISGDGTVLDTSGPVCAIGSGGEYAYSAALALCRHTNMNAEQIAKNAMEIASDLCIQKQETADVEIDNTLQDYLKEIENVLENESNFCKEHKVNEVKLDTVTVPTSSDDVITEIAQEFDETSQNEPPPPSELSNSTIQLSSQIEQSLKSSSYDIMSVVNEYQTLIDKLSLNTTDENMSNITQQYTDRLTELTNNLMLLYNKNSNIQFHYFQTLSMLSTLKSKLVDYVKKIEIFQNEFKTMKSKYETKINQYESILNNYQTYINEVNNEKSKLSEENDRLLKEIEDKEDEIDEIKTQSKKEIEEYRMKKILELNELKSKYENQIKHIEESTKEIIDNLHKKLNELITMNENNKNDGYEELVLSVNRDMIQTTENAVIGNDSEGEKRKEKEEEEEEEDNDDDDSDEDDEKIKQLKAKIQEEEKVEEEMIVNMKGDLSSDEGSFVDSYTQSKSRTGSLISKLQLIV